MSFDVIVMDFEEFARQHDADRFQWDVATNRLPNTSVGQRKRIQARENLKSGVNLDKRAALRSEYNRLVDEGLIRPPTHEEIVARNALGHEDNPFAQAARRVLEKRKQRGQ